MVWTIVKQQFLSNIFTQRFTIGFILCEILFVSSAFILMKDYKERILIFRDANQKHEDELNHVLVYSDLYVGLDKPPSTLSFFCEGFDKRFASSVYVSPTTYNSPFSIGRKGYNPLLVVFPSIDMATIIQIVLSLLILLLSYDAISGEREKGSLRQILSNQVPRYYVLVGKYIGSMVSTVLLLIFGFFSGLLVIQLSPYVSLNVEEWIRLGVIFICAVIYLSFFYVIGILFSVATNHSTTSIISLLFIWILLVILLPNISAYISRQVIPIEDKAFIDRQAEAIINEFYQKFDRYAEGLQRPLHDWNFIIGRKKRNGLRPYPRRYYYAPREIIEWELKGVRYGLPLHIQYINQVRDLYRTYQANLVRQASLAANISRFSPGWLFYNICSIFALTDEHTQLDFHEQSQIYRSELISYIQNKGGFSGLPWFTRKKMHEFLSTNELVAIREKHGLQAVRNLIGSGWADVKPLNLNDMPRFKFKTRTIGKCFYSAMGDITILIFLNLIFFIMSYVMFLRAHVR